MSVSIFALLCFAHCQKRGCHEKFGNHWSIVRDPVSVKACKTVCVQDCVSVFVCLCLCVSVCLCVYESVYVSVRVSVFVCLCCVYQHSKCL